MGQFFKIFSNLAQNLRKFWKDWVFLLNIWPKIGPTGIWMGHFFWENWYQYGSTFKFCGGTSLPKPNLNTPPPPPACTISCQTPVCYHSIIQAVSLHCWRKICNSNKEHLIFPYVFITELLQRSYDPLDATVYNVWIVLLQSQVVSALMLFLLLDLSAEISNRHKQRTFY